MILAGILTMTVHRNIGKGASRGRSRQRRDAPGDADEEELVFSDERFHGDFKVLYFIRSLNLFGRPSAGVPEKSPDISHGKSETRNKILEQLLSH